MKPAPPGSPSATPLLQSAAVAQEGVGQPPEADYRGFVGPKGRYDYMGGTQFALLWSLGLRAGHRLLDIGCGSLRGGRLYIAYLDPDRYTGLEPETWLVEEALDQQIGRDVVALKRPTFVHNDRFDVSGLGTFDFVVAQSVASHTGPAMTAQLLAAVRSALAPTGMAAVTFVHGWRDNRLEGWHYFEPPHVTRYRRRTIAGWLADADLDGAPLPWFHPGYQTWWLIVPRGRPLPPWWVRGQLRGGSLAAPDGLAPVPKLQRARRALQRRLPLGRR